MSLQEAMMIAKRVLTVSPEPSEIRFILAYTERKCRLNGLGLTGVRLIIEDEIRNHFSRQVSEDFYEGVTEGRKDQCASCA